MPRFSGKKKFINFFEKFRERFPLGLQEGNTMLLEGHLDGDVLELYAMGRLSEAASEPVEEHILVCETCQERLTEAESYVRAMRGALDKSQQAGQTHPFLNRVRGFFEMPQLAWGSVGVAACAAAVFLSTMVMKRDGPPVAVSLSAMRGADAVVAAGGPLDLDLDMNGLPAASYRVEVVDASGKPIWSVATSAVQNGRLRTRVGKRLAPGQYFIRVNPADGSTAREYGLSVK
jgi:hypothetical protein